MCEDPLVPPVSWLPAFEAYKAARIGGRARSGIRIEELSKGLSPDRVEVLKAAIDGLECCWWYHGAESR